MISGRIISIRCCSSGDMDSFRPSMIMEISSFVKERPCSERRLEAAIRSGRINSRDGRNGAKVLPMLLETHAPLDQVVLMLGTNDCKTYNHASADRIGKGIEKLIQQIRKADPAIDILLVSPIELGEDVWKPGFDLEFDQHSVKVSKQLKQTYLKIAWKYGCDFLAASDVAKPSKADMEHMNEKGHKNLAKAIESFLVEKERNHSNNYVNVV